MEKEIKKGENWRKAFQMGYKEGRQSVIDELKEEQKKLLQGFAYRKKKK